MVAVNAEAWDPRTPWIVLREKTTQRMNGEEWAPNEAKLVDLRVPVPAREREEQIHERKNGRRDLGVKTSPPIGNRVSSPFSGNHCDNIFLGLYENYDTLVWIRATISFLHDKYPEDSSILFFFLHGLTVKGSIVSSLSLSSRFLFLSSWGNSMKINIFLGANSISSIQSLDGSCS